MINVTAIDDSCACSVSYSQTHSCQSKYAFQPSILGVVSVGNKVRFERVFPGEIFDGTFLSEVLQKKHYYCTWNRFFSSVTCFFYKKKFQTWYKIDLDAEEHDRWREVATEFSTRVSSPFRKCRGAAQTSRKIPLKKTKTGILYEIEPTEVEIEYVVLSTVVIMLSKFLFGVRYTISDAIGHRRRRGDGQFLRRRWRVGYVFSSRARTTGRLWTLRAGNHGPHTSFTSRF